MSWFSIVQALEHVQKHGHFKETFACVWPDWSQTSCTAAAQHNKTSLGQCFKSGIRSASRPWSHQLSHRNTLERAVSNLSANSWMTATTTTTGINRLILISKAIKNIPYNKITDSHSVNSLSDHRSIELQFWQTSSTSGVLPNSRIKYSGHNL